MAHPKIVKTASILTSEWLTVTNNNVVLPDGEIVNDYYVGAKTNFATILPVFDDGTVLLIREYHFVIKDYTVGLPAGGIKDNEEALDAARRELLEETGYAADKWKFLGDFYVSSSWLKDKAFLFIAQGLIHTGNQSLDDTEDIHLLRVPFQEAVEMVYNNGVEDPYSATTILMATRYLK